MLQADLREVKNPREGGQYPGRELNPYFRFGKQDFKSCASTNSATRVIKQAVKKQIPCLLPCGP